MAGNPLYRVNADSGARRGLLNVAGHPIRSWDAREHAFRLAYDPAQRPTHRYVSTSGAAEILIDQAVYGEGQAAANLCGRLFRHYDMAGYVENSQYDYKGNLLSGFRQLAADYHQAIDWTALADLTSAAQLDAAAAAAGLVPTGDGGRDRFGGSTVYDALNRPIQVVTPHSATMKPDVLRPGYDEAALLSQMNVWLQQAAAPAALLDPATADRHAVTGIDYNARGQRLEITFGNGTGCAYDYDPQTFRLAHLTTTRPASFAPDQRRVQALAYYYDPAGNITRIRDDADTQDVIFFRNQRVEPSASYTYDPLYRLHHRHRPRASRPDRRSALATAAGHQRRLVPHRPAAAWRRERDGHLHRDIRLRRAGQPAHHGSPGQLRRLDAPLQLRRAVADRGRRDRQPPVGHQPAR